MKDTEFSPTSYKQLVETFLMAGYRFNLFCESLWEEKLTVFFRHDVDVDVFAALGLAKLEKESDIKSTYCFSLCSPYYNLFSPIERSVIKDISEMGHDIAFHFDNVDSDGTPQNIYHEIEIFFSLFPFANKKIFSLHRPKILNGQKVDHLMNLSSTQIDGHNVFYVSDSTGKWLYGYPLSSKEFAYRMNMQVLTHPIWWMRNGQDPFEKLDRSLSAINDEKKEYLAVYLPKLFRALKGLG